METKAMMPGGRETHFPNVLVVGILRPRVQRNLKNFLVNINKPCFFVPSLEFVGNAEWSPEDHGRFISISGPFRKGPIVLHGIVIAVDGAHNLLEWTNATDIQLRG